MKDKIVIDLQKIMDEIFEATKSFGDAVKDGFESMGSQWGEGNVDFYPAYSYPPANVYITKEKELVFQFALAGFDPDKIELCFQGDYMVLSAMPLEQSTEDIRYFKRRLKFKEVTEQKYFAPSDKFDRSKVKAVFSHGLLTVSMPGKDKPEEKKEKINIKVEKEA